MAWNKLDGTKTSRNSNQYQGNPQQGYPPYQRQNYAQNQSNVPQHYNQSRDLVPAQRNKDGLNPGALVLSIVLAGTAIGFIPEIPVLLPVVGGIVTYFIMSRILPGRKVKQLEPPKAAEPQKLEETKPEVEPEKPVNEVEKIINDGRLYLDAIKRINNKIASNEPAVFQQIVRMEECIEKIFDYISEHPEDAPQIRKFMNYYLPTLLKLLNSYDTLKQQGIKGDHINATITDIEGILHTMAIAFEKQLDNLFADDAMDIATDITVLKNMLAQEGLTEDNMVMPDLNNLGKDIELQ